MFNKFCLTPVFSVSLSSICLNLPSQSLSFYLFTFFISLRLLYFLCICVSFGLFAPCFVVFPSPITSTSYCVIGVCHCSPFSISTSLLHLCSFSPSLSVLPSLPSSICLSLCSHSEGPQTHLCALICCAIVPLTPCCQPLGPLSH